MEIEENLWNGLKAIFQTGNNEYNGSLSDIKNIQAGVPQGSVLGPLLFLIYINEIGYKLDSLAILFPDDSSIPKSSSIDSHEIVYSINRDLDTLHQWSLDWLVSFNPSKTKEVIF